MFGFLKKKKKEKGPPTLLDLDGMETSEGDVVLALRYDLGLSRVSLEGLQYFYESEESGKKVSYTKMIDAITGHQKVRKQSD
jgi:hypothetical protein